MSSQQEQQQQHESVISATAASISRIKLNESDALKQNPLSSSKLSKNNHPDQVQLRAKQLNSLPVSEAAGEQIEQLNMDNTQQQQASLPTQLESEQQQQQQQQQPAKEGANRLEEAAADKENVREDEDFQMVEMVGPSLAQPDKIAADGQPPQTAAKAASSSMQNSALREQLLASSSSGGGGSYANNHAAGDSLIDMIIALRNENQTLARALEANHANTKERLNEFERVQEEAKRRELQFGLERAEHEHEARKLRRQNGALSERLKSLEVKLSSMRLEVGESLNAAHSSGASSMQGGQQQQPLYPNLGADDESFSNQALLDQTPTATMLIDATSGELLNDDRQQQQQQRAMDSRAPQPPAPMACGMSREQLSEHFDVKRREFNALAGDPMKQCDQLERQLDETIGKRTDHEIGSLQQRLNLFRQDFRLERMDKLEAMIRIERLKNDTDRLCLERLTHRMEANDDSGASSHRRRSRRRSGSAVRFESAESATATKVVGGHRASKRAAKAAAKAARYAAKQARREERASAAATAAKALASSCLAAGHHHHHNGQAADPLEADEPAHHGHCHRGHHRHHYRGHLGRHQLLASAGSIRRSEVVNDLLVTANKAMLTGYKMASTGVNLALDKLSQYEQQQAAMLAAKSQPSKQAASAPS